MMGVASRVLLAAAVVLAGPAAEQKLVFDENGQFKIAQFADRKPDQKTRNDFHCCLVPSSTFRGGRGHAMGAAARRGGLSTSISD